MTANLSELTLRHVDPARLLFQQRHPAFPDAVAPPEWYVNANKGELRFAPWLRGTVLAVMEVKAQKDAYFAVVGVLGLYMTDEQAAAQEEEFSNEVDNSTLAVATPEEMMAFQERVVDDLYPFVRSELYGLTGRLQGIFGVMLQPQPLLGRPRDAIGLRAAELGYEISRNIATNTDTYELPNGRVAVQYSKDGDVAVVEAEPAGVFPSTIEGALGALDHLAP